MSSKTNAQVAAELDAKWGTAGSSVGFLSLLTVITSISAGTVTESADGAFARQAITWAAATAATRNKANSADITFPVSTGANGPVVGYGVYTLVSGGTLQRVIPISPSLTYTAGYQIVVSAGAVVITEAAAA